MIFINCTSFVYKGVFVSGNLCDDNGFVYFLLLLHSRYAAKSPTGIFVPAECFQPHGGFWLGFWSASSLARQSSCQVVWSRRVETASPPDATNDPTGSEGLVCGRAGKTTASCQLRGHIRKASKNLLVWGLDKHCLVFNYKRSIMTKWIFRWCFDVCKI